MDNQSQQITEYIQEQLRQGHTEADIRSHLQQHGWQEQAVNNALAQFHTVHGATQTLVSPAPPGAAATGAANGESDKSYVAAWLLSVFLGGFGIDRVYLGYVGLGIVKFLTGGGFGVWNILDIILIGFGVLKDKQGRPLKGFTRHRRLIKILTVIIVGIAPLSLIGLIILLTAASVPSLNTHASNTERQNDAASLAAAVASYEAAHNGALPQSTKPGHTYDVMYVCGADCSSGSGVPATISYDSSRPTVVSVRPYTVGLTVPSDRTLYIVDNASCDSGKTGLGTQSTGAVAILYALDSGSGPKQQCLGV